MKSKPICNVAIVSKVLSRAANAILPEGRLVLALICQAIADAAGTEADGCDDAIRFLRGKRLDNFAGLISLDSDWVREVASKSGHLVTE